MFYLYGGGCFYNVGLVVNDEFMVIKNVYEMLVGVKLNIYLK